MHPCDLICHRAIPSTACVLRWALIDLMDLAVSIQFLLELLARISCDAHHALAQLASPAEV